MNTPYQMIQKDVLGGNTGALYNKITEEATTHVGVPSAENVEEAKEWVDNESRL